MRSREEMMSRVRSSLIVMITGQSERALGWTPGVPLWSTKQLLVHLAVSEGHFMAEICSSVREPIPKSGHLLSDGRNMNVEVILSELNRIRCDSALVLARLTPEQWKTRLRFSSHPLLVMRTAAEATDFMIWHEARHVLQIEALLKRANATMSET